MQTCVPPAMLSLSFSRPTKGFDEVVPVIGIHSGYRFCESSRIFPDMDHVNFPNLGFGDEVVDT